MQRRDVRNGKNLSLERVFQTWRSLRRSVRCNYFGIHGSTHRPLPGCPRLDCAVDLPAQDTNLPVATARRANRAAGRAARICHSAPGSGNEFRGHVDQCRANGLTPTTVRPGPGLIVTTPAAARFESAMAFFNAGQYADAVTAFSDFVRDFPDDRRREEALYRLAESYRNLGRSDDALAAYTFQVQTYPDGPLRVNGELRRGAILFDAGKFADAIAPLQVVVDKGDGELQEAAKYLAGPRPSRHAKGGRWPRAAARPRRRTTARKTRRQRGADARRTGRHAKQIFRGACALAKGAGSCRPIPP